MKNNRVPLSFPGSLFVFLEDGSMMQRFNAWIAVGALLVVAAAATAQEPGPPRLERPSEPYRQATIQIPTEPTPTTLHLHLRGKRASAVRALRNGRDQTYLRTSDRTDVLMWKLMPESVNRSDSFGTAMRNFYGDFYLAWQTKDLEWGDQTVRGVLTQRTVDEKVTVEQVRWEIEGRIAADGSITGTINGKPLTGQVRTAEQLRKTQAIAADSSFPNRWGPQANSTAPKSSRPYREDLNTAPELWFSETYFGGGRGPFLVPMGGDWWGPMHGGWATPVVGDGRVYLHHNWPNPTVQGGRRERKQHVTRQPLLGDDIVTCLDGATGQILWNHVFPLDSVAVVGDKGGARNNTGVYHQGKYIAMSYGGMLRAFDGETGKLLWGRPATGHHANRIKHRATVLEQKLVTAPQGDQPNLLAIGPVVLVGGRAHRLTDGEEVWSAPGTPLLWIAGGAERVIMINGTDLSCRNAADGVEIWTGKIAAAREPTIIDNTLIVQGRAAAGEPFSLFAYQLSDKGISSAWQTARPEAQGAVAPVRAPDGIFFVEQCTEGMDMWGMVLADTKTGKVLKAQPFPESRPWRPQLLSLGDRVLILADAGHSMPFSWYDARTLERLGERFNPPHPRHEGGYRGPLGLVVADGRFIIRGAHRLYCHDLRIDP
jgi:outer membrane protein assembly factor BamB